MAWHHVHHFALIRHFSNFHSLSPLFYAVEALLASKSAACLLVRQKMGGKVRGRLSPSPALD
jgi:hypothetical protein